MAAKLKLIRHEESCYNVGQAKKHLRHHKGVKLLAKQIAAKKKPRDKDD